MVEQVNGTLENILRKLTVECPSKWAIYLSSAVFPYNIGYHSYTGHSPFKMLYSCQPLLPLLLYNLVKDTEPEGSGQYVEKLVDMLINIQTDAYSNILTKIIKAHDKSKDIQRTLPKFNIDDEVMFYHNCGFGFKRQIINFMAWANGNFPNYWSKCLYFKKHCQ